MFLAFFQGLFVHSMKKTLSPLRELLDKFDVVLASSSPQRKAIFNQLVSLLNTGG